MELDYGKVFNLMDTNGRRADVINALFSYLSFLKEGNEKDPNYEWTNFPKSLNQYLFYKRSIEESSDVFASHQKFDNFQEKYKLEIDQFILGNKGPLFNKISQEDKKVLDIAIESRARHYSSNLVKLGFINSNRKITPAGLMFLDKNLIKDKFESILPLTNTNISLIRQLMKLRIYSKNQNGHRRFYSPFLFAIYILLKKNQISITDFRFLVQSTSPYSNKSPNQLIEEYFNNSSDLPIDSIYPSQIMPSERLSFPLFEELFTNNKSGKAVEEYWKFYNLLYDFKINKDNRSYLNLLTLFKNSNLEEKLKKAFGFGKPIFDFGEHKYFTDQDFFLSLNKNNELLNSRLDFFNTLLYKRFLKSKYFDMAIEYSDTTKRIFSASGIFKFEKGICKLAYKELLSEIFAHNYLENNIFGSSTEADYMNYEGNNELTYYAKVHAISEIMEIDKFKTEIVINQIESNFGASISNVTKLIRDNTNLDFIGHINQKYPKNKVLELLKLFEDRSNDYLLKEYVNPEATVPTIYEYLVAIAWFYLSEKKINLFDSLNLTLNADFEPVLHASGGDGDIVVREENRVTMLEVTLMGRSSQGRAEMEPVLRHSNNLKVKYPNLETMTFFIACELDLNTVNIWRNILSQEQIATLNSTVVNGTMIMSLTNNEICKFIESNITSNQIIETTRMAFLNGKPENGWRDKIVNSLVN